MDCSWKDLLLEVLLVLLGIILRVPKVLSHARYLPRVVDLIVIMIVLMRLEVVRRMPASSLSKRLISSWMSSLHLILDWFLRDLQLLSLHHVRRGIVYDVLLSCHHVLGMGNSVILCRVRRSIVSHVLELLLLLHHHNSLSMLPKLKLLLLIDEHEELVPSHRKNLVKPTKHEAFEVFIRDAEDRRTVAFDFALSIENVV